METDLTQMTVGNPGTAERRRYVEAANRQYHPCDTGLHVCGINDERPLPAGPHYTLLNVPLNAGDARRIFDRLKPVFEVSDDEGDVLVDLFIHGSTEDDFWMRRQMFERFAREAESNGCPTTARKSA